jgi:hypothetical protein
MSFVDLISGSNQLIARSQQANSATSTQKTSSISQIKNVPQTCELVKEMKMIACKVIFIGKNV